MRGEGEGRKVKKEKEKKREGKGTEVKEIIKKNVGKIIEGKEHWLWRGRSGEARGRGEAWRRGERIQEREKWGRRGIGREGCNMGHVEGGF